MAKLSAKYEILYIIDPAQGEEGIQALVEKVKAVVEDHGTLTSVEVVEVGLSMDELPRELVVKTPTDGLSGMSDEEKLGVLYRDIHAYIREGTCGNPETDEKIRGMEKRNMHKRRMPLVLDPFGKDGK